MHILLFLMLFPLIPAVVLLAVSHEKVKRMVVYLSAGLLIIASIYLFISRTASYAMYYGLHIDWVNQLFVGLEVLLAFYIICMGIKHKRYLISLLMLLQSGLLLYFECVYGHGLNISYNLFVDHFSILMALIVGIIGGLICIYALGYMRDYHEHHPEIQNRSKLFFFIVFIFLAAMYGIIFSNNLLWLYFFWEVTTLCSFLLIGYSQTEVAVNNSFKALWMNLLGGLAFAAAIIYAYTAHGVIELDKLISLGKPAALLPVVLITFAGLTKSAQLPFSGWLLGAMVAPTPTSALLHSSTMVKAGVYILIRLAPVLQESWSGLMVSLIGGLTFLITSFIAITQEDSKKVLAYSTIANLGLIVACAGVGTYEAVWAGVLLIVFHAIAKSLMFLSVGTIEHAIGSRNIEDMHGLIRTMPRLTVMMIIGIAGMFLAPFGMLISKWAALKAFVDSNIILVFCLAFGSAATLYFWTKWMGKLISRGAKERGLEDHVNKDEWIPLTGLSVLTILVCALFPLISYFLVEPFVIYVYGLSAKMSYGNTIIMGTMLGLILLLPLELLWKHKDVKYTPPYLCGANTKEDGSRFLGAMGLTRKVFIQNYYMTNYFPETKFTLVGSLVCTALILLMFGGGIL